MTITAETFVDAVTQLCGAAAKLGTGAAVELHRTSGVTGLAIDNVAEATDERRTELVSMFQRLAPLEGIPAGISRRGSVTITRDG